MKKTDFCRNRWQWIRIEIDSDQDFKSLPELPGPCYQWFRTLKSDNNSNLEMETGKKGQESMWGSLIYHQDLGERKKQNILQYYLSYNTLITNHLDISLLYNLTEEQLSSKLEKAENALEGFMILLGEVVASYLRDIDAFENRMHDLLWRMKEKNDEDVLDQIIRNRHEILVWKNLIIPITEIREALVEAFGDEAGDGPHYIRTYRRIGRCRQIIREFDEEVREMTDLETVLSSHRGNEIVKTLTVITMLFTPVAAWGAVWGMNFEAMPELKWKYGYLAALLFILLSTWVLYYYLKKKKWIGSILKSGKGDKF